MGVFYLNRERSLIEKEAKRRIDSNHNNNISSNNSYTIHLVLDLEIDQSESVDRPLTIVHQLPSLQFFTTSLL